MTKLKQQKDKQEATDEKKDGVPFPLDLFSKVMYDEDIIIKITSYLPMIDAISLMQSTSEFRGKRVWIKILEEKAEFTQKLYEEIEIKQKELQEKFNENKPKLETIDFYVFNTKDISDLSTFQRPRDEVLIILEAVLVILTGKQLPFSEIKKLMTNSKEFYKLVRIDTFNTYKLAYSY